LKPQSIIRDQFTISKELFCAQASIEVQDAVICILIRSKEIGGVSNLICSAETARGDGVLEGFADIWIEVCTCILATLERGRSRIIILLKTREEQMNNE